MTPESYNRSLKAAVAIIMLVSMAAAILWTVVQHTAFIAAQQQAMRAQTAALETYAASAQAQANALHVLSQIHEERLEINRQLWLQQQEQTRTLGRIEQLLKDMRDQERC